MKGCDAVYHFAAEADIGELVNLQETLYQIIFWERKMFEAARKLNVKRIMFEYSLCV